MAKLAGRQNQVEVHQGRRPGSASRGSGDRCLTGSGEAFTLPTTELGPDVAPVHDHQIVVLYRADWLAWLDLMRPRGRVVATATDLQLGRRASALSSGAAVDCASMM